MIAIGSDVSPARRLRAIFIMLVATGCLLATWSTLEAQSAAPTALTLGGAARVAADRSASTAAARERSSQADARVSQRRSELLPNLSTTAQFGTRSFNTASLGIDFPSAPGGSASFDRNGEVRGPVRSIDMRARVTQQLINVPSVLTWRATATEARIAAREADSSLAAELLDIAKQQLTAGVGISLDVTRAESQLADTRARLIATRGERDRSVLQLRHELSLADGAPLVIAGSLRAPAASDTSGREDEIIQNALNTRADFRAALTQSEGARLQARAVTDRRPGRGRRVACMGDAGDDSTRAGPGQSGLTRHRRPRARSARATARQEGHPSSSRHRRRRSRAGAPRATAASDRRCCFGDLQRRCDERNACDTGSRAMTGTDVA